MKRREFLAAVGESSPAIREKILDCIEKSVGSTTICYGYNGLDADDCDNDDIIGYTFSLKTSGITIHCERYARGLEKKYSFSIPLMTAEGEAVLAYLEKSFADDKPAYRT